MVDGHSKLCIAREAGVTVPTLRKWIVSPALVSKKSADRILCTVLRLGVTTSDLRPLPVPENFTQSRRLADAGEHC